MQMRRVLRVVFALAIPAVLGCGGAAPPPPAAETPAASPVDLATAGHVAGKIVLQGEAPQAEVIKMGADPFCMTEAHGDQTTEYFVVGDDNGLDNVFVYVKSGLDDRSFPAPTEPARLDQKGCRYYPHVIGVQVGQPVEISNSDDTLHNVHAVPTVNREFNVGQPIKGMKNEITFTTPEIMVPFKCDVHGWMNAYVGVVAHPYFAVSANGGTFELRSLPPGTYEIEAWHEKLGTQTQTVTIGEKETANVSFTFTLGS